MVQRAEIAVNGYVCAVRDASRRVAYADDAREAELSGDDRAVREHAASFDDETRNQAEDRSPAWIRLAGHEDLAPLKQSSLAHVAEHRGARVSTAAARAGALQHRHVIGTQARRSIWRVVSVAHVT